MYPSRASCVLVAAFIGFGASLAYGQELSNCFLNPCGANARCTTTDLGYKCTCVDSTQWYNYTAGACQDINECMTGPCPAGATCRNTLRGYSCICPCGYTWFFNSTTSSCVDIDECRLGVCGEARCRNLPGSYSCVCPKGYYYSNGLCVDIDECAVQKPPCGGSSRCNNTPGGYTCTCPKIGYVYSSTRDDCVPFVINLDPCTFFPCGKSPNACVSGGATSNTYTCKCASDSVLYYNSNGKQGCYNATIKSHVGLITNTTLQPFQNSLDIKWNQRVAGNNIWQWTYNGNPAQQFYLVPYGSGYYWIKENSLLYCLGAASASSASGTDVVLQTCSQASSARFWRFNMHPTDPNLFQISPKHAPTMCISIAGDSTAQQALAELQLCTKNTRGQWYRILAQ